MDPFQDPDPHLTWHVSFGNTQGSVVFIDAHNGDLVYTYDTTHYFDFDLSDAHGHSANHDCYAFTP